MVSKKPDDVMELKCECGSDKFVVYQAVTTGYVQTTNVGLIPMPLPLKDREEHMLTLCLKCSRVVDFMVCSEITR